MIILRVANGNAFSDRTFSSGLTAGTSGATDSTRSPVINFATRSEVMKTTNEGANYSMRPIHRLSLVSPVTTTSTKIHLDEEAYPSYVVGEAR